jgi:hypothetical protein
MKRRDLLALASGVVAFGFAGRGSAIARAECERKDSARPAAFSPPHNGKLTFHAETLPLV